MKNPWVVGLGVGLAVAVGGGAFASYRIASAEPRYAQVLSVKPLTKTVKIARQDCHDEQVTRRRDPQDPHQVGGSVAGAVIGGVLGNQIGGGSGKALATAAGVVAGGYAGNRIEKRVQEGDTYTATERRCVTVYDTHEKSLGFEVRYRLGKKVATVRMRHDPGRRIPVEHGKLVLEEPSAHSTGPQPAES